MNGATDPTRGCIRPCPGDSAGIALPSASRTSRRCTPNFRATPGNHPTAEFVVSSDLFETFHCRFPPSHLALPLAVRFCP